MSKIDKVEVRMGGALVGHLAQTTQGLCAFEYTRQWLAEGYSISPFELPLTPGVKLAKPTPFGGNFGVFDDALPDGWGMLILDRHLRRQGINPASLGQLDLLALVGSSGRGALEFVPDMSPLPESEAARIGQLAGLAARILGEEDYTGAGIDELWARGGSPGGARPKVFIHADGSEWLVKFPARHDPSDIGQQEYAYSQLARQCGVDMPETRLFEGRFFGAKRFDRRPQGRIHTVSAAGLLQADYRIPSIDYSHLMRLTQLLTHSEEELWRMFRLMAFNHAIGNKDDHAKNFSFQHLDGCWRMSPAYDLLPSNGFNGYHTTTCNGQTEPSDTDLVDLARQSGLPAAKAKATLDNILETVRTHTPWQQQ